ncbi:MAG TPA: hypothetical protein QF695_02585 [Arenicellales bacterium]|nr:hypothetical protein [Arenicellales bacterium]
MAGSKDHCVLHDCGGDSSVLAGWGDYARRTDAAGALIYRARPLCCRGFGSGGTPVDTPSSRALETIVSTGVVVMK